MSGRRWADAYKITTLKIHLTSVLTESIPITQIRGCYIILFFPRLLSLHSQIFPFCHIFSRIGNKLFLVLIWYFNLIVNSSSYQELWALQQMPLLSNFTFLIPFSTPDFHPSTISLVFSSTSISLTQHYHLLSLCSTQVSIYIHVN